jgi:hypothetical protein
MRLKQAVCTGVVLDLTCGSASWAFSDDVYSSINGQLMGARLTQSESAFEGPDQVFSIASWNGKTLGTEWELSCNQQTTPADVVVGLDPNGNNIVITTIVFQGGNFHLCQVGPWGNDVYGTALTNQVVLTEYYEAGRVVRAEMVSEAVGRCNTGRAVQFNFSRCMAWGEMEEPMPGYPELLDQNCAPTRVHGYWGEMTDVTIRLFKKPPACIPLIASPTSGDLPAVVERTTWGAMKALYR